MYIYIYVNVIYLNFALASKPLYTHHNMRCVHCTNVLKLILRIMFILLNVRLTSNQIIIIYIKHVYTSINSQKSLTYTGS